MFLMKLQRVTHTSKIKKSTITATTNEIERGLLKKSQFKLGNTRKIDSQNANINPYF